MTLGEESRHSLGCARCFGPPEAEGGGTGRVSVLLLCGVLMNVSPSEDQRRAIADIVEAVYQGRQWRVGVLLEQFVQEADLPSLLALREALSDDVQRGRRH